jgi:hypothetical protein
LKFLAIHVATIAAVARLGTLRNRGSRSGRRYFDVIGFFISPLRPISQLVHRSVRSLKNRQRRGPCAGDISYHIVAAFGVEVPSGNGHIPLLDVGYHRLQRISERYDDLYWAGSLVLLLVFIIQAISTLVLFVRRNLLGQATAVDEWAASIALGELFSQLVSLGLSVMNFDWSLVDVNMELAPGDPANNSLPRYLVVLEDLFGELANDRGHSDLGELHCTFLASITWNMLIQGTVFEYVAMLMEVMFLEILLHARESGWEVALSAIAFRCMMAMATIGFVISICDICSTFFLRPYSDGFVATIGGNLNLLVTSYVFCGIMGGCLTNQFPGSLFDILHMKSSAHWYDLGREPSVTWKDPLAEKLLIF